MLTSCYVVLFDFSGVCLVRFASFFMLLFSCFLVLLLLAFLFQLFVFLLGCFDVWWLRCFVMGARLDCFVGFLCLLFCGFVLLIRVLLSPFCLSSSFVALSSCLVPFFARRLGKTTHLTSKHENEELRNGQCYHKQNHVPERFA